MLFKIDKNEFYIFNFYRNLNFGTLKKVKELKVLDGKAAQNISILLGGSLKHMAYDDIKKCLLRCDDTVLTQNVLEQLIQVTLSIF